ncbi:MAG: R3H domain-containing nucleic acid-binding protein, partial [Anaerolineales bacterium]
SARRAPQSGYRRQTALPTAPQSNADGLPYSPTAPHMPGKPLAPIRIFPFGVARNRLRQASKRLGVPSVLADSLGDAEVLVTLRSNFRKRPRVIKDAENRRMPIYVLRSNTVNQMEGFLIDLYNLRSSSFDDPSMDKSLDEANNAIQRVLDGTRSIDLSPTSSYIRRLQHQMARQANLVSHSYGKEPHRRVRIFRN